MALKALFIRNNMESRVRPGAQGWIVEGGGGHQSKMQREMWIRVGLRGGGYNTRNHVRCQVLRGVVY